MSPAGRIMPAGDFSLGKIGNLAKRKVRYARNRYRIAQVAFRRFHATLRRFQYLTRLYAILAYLTGYPYPFLI